MIDVLLIFIESIVHQRLNLFTPIWNGASLGCTLDLTYLGRSNGVWTYHSQIAVITTTDQSQQVSSDSNVLSLTDGDLDSAKQDSPLTPHIQFKFSPIESRGADSQPLARVSSSEPNVLSLTDDDLDSAK